MKIAVIGHVDHGKVSMIEALVKGVEKKTGEKIELVTIHEKELEFLTQEIHINKPSDLEFEINNSMLEEPFPKSKPFAKGHEHPYKYHR